MSELKIIENYIEKRMEEEGYRHRKHYIYQLQSNRPSIIATLLHELEIVQSEIKRKKSERTN